MIDFFFPLLLLLFIVLAQNRYFTKPEFVGYLKYLLYWKRPEYAKYLVYPHCLAMLDRLQDASFREALLHPETSDRIHEQQYYHWAHGRNVGDSSGPLDL